MRAAACAAAMTHRGPRRRGAIWFSMLHVVRVAEVEHRAVGHQGGEIGGGLRAEGQLEARQPGHALGQSLRDQAELEHRKGSGYGAYPEDSSTPWWPTSAGKLARAAWRTRTSLAAGGGLEDGGPEPTRRSPLRLVVTASPPWNGSCGSGSATSGRGRRFHERHGPDRGAEPLALAGPETGWRRCVDRYEAAWKAGRRPRIADYLGEVPEVESADSLFHELLVLELAYRRRAGRAADAGGVSAAAGSHWGRFTCRDRESSPGANALLRGRPAFGPARTRTCCSA